MCLNNLGKGQSLDEILEKHFEAVGMNRLAEVETIQYSGYFYNRFLEKMGSNIPVEILKPPFELTVKKGKAYLLQISNGTRNIATCFYNGSYWLNQNGNINENWTPGKADRQIIDQELYPCGFLYDWKENGYQLNKLDDAAINNKLHFKLQLVKSENDTSYYYIDKQTFIINFLSYNGDLCRIGNKCQHIEFQKYKLVKGILIPFKQIRTDLMLDGTYDSKEIIIREVKINMDLNEDMFKTQIKN
jgi:hypothetical protein